MTDKKRAAPEPYHCGRGPARSPQEPSEIERAWIAWQEAKHAEDAAFHALRDAQAKGAASLAAIHARRDHTAATNTTIAARARMRRLAQQATGAIPHDVPEEAHR